MGVGVAVGSGIKVAVGGAASVAAGGGVVGSGVAAAAVAPMVFGVGVEVGGCTLGVTVQAGTNNVTAIAIVSTTKYRINFPFIQKAPKRITPYTAMVSTPSIAA